MKHDDVDLKREHMTASLEKVWTLYEETQRFLNNRIDEKHAPTPDFTATTERLIPSEIDEKTLRLETSSLAQLSQMVKDCKLCGLCSTRTHAVVGEGVMNPRVMVIGEGPGADEDKAGRPFVGRSGQYIDRWLAAIDLDREHNVYIANIVKCRPPGNRNPYPDEAQACLPYLKRQIQLIKPESILCVGLVAAQFLLTQDKSLADFRGSFFRFEGIPVLVTYHPAAVLRRSELRAPVWADMQRLAAFLRIELPSRRS
jgi:uracil-DNA glycosylase